MILFKTCVLIKRDMKKVTVWSPMLVVKSNIFIKSGMKKSRSGAPCQTLHFYSEGYEEVMVWSPMLMVKSCTLIERGMKSHGLELHACECNAELVNHGQPCNSMCMSLQW